MNDSHLGVKFKTISNKLTREMDKRISKEVDSVTSAHGWLISFLYHEGKTRDVFQRDIEEHFRIRRSTASNIVSLMEKKGLLVRSSVDYDARLKKIELTDKGIAMHESIKQIIDNMEDELAGIFSEDELKLFFEFLDRVEKKL